MLILDEIIESLRLFRLNNPEDFDRRSKCPFFDNTLKLGECQYCKLLFPEMMDTARWGLIACPCLSLGYNYVKSEMQRLFPEDEGR